MKLKPNFSLAFGVRYELPSVATEKRGKASNFIPGVGAVLAGTNQLLDIDPTKRGRDSFVYSTAPLTLPAAGVNSDNNNFAPMTAQTVCRILLRTRFNFRLGISTLRQRPKGSARKYRDQKTNPHSPHMACLSMLWTELR